MASLHRTSVNIYVVVWILFFVNGLHKVKCGFCSTRNLDIPNGDYNIRSGNSIVRYTCNTGFQLYGAEQLVCFGSKWSDDPPICIAKTCTPIPSTSVLRIKQEFDGALLTFSCAALHRLSGSAKLLCTGTQWTAKPPTCEPWNPMVACDLESPDLCGWSHDELGDQEWRWHTGSTPTSRTGPSHDHTKGPDGNGHYVYFETSSPTRTLHKAMLNSPLYTPEYSVGKCFSFWYHVYGTDDIGDLELFFKPEGVNVSSLQPSFLVNEDSGDVWYNHSVPVTPQTTAFQDWEECGKPLNNTKTTSIVFVATRGNSYRSDFALDDFSLGECAVTNGPVQSTTVENTKPVTTLETKTLAPATTTKAPLTTTQQTTTKAPATTKETAQTTTGAPVTTEQPTTITTTKAPVTTTGKTIQTTTKAPVTTAQQTTQKTTQAPTTIKTTVTITQTTSKPITTQTTVKPIITTEQTTFKTTKSVDMSTTTIVSTETTISTTSSNNNLKPIVNPNLPEKKSNFRYPESKDQTSQIVYIVIGISLVIAVAGIVGVGIFCYKRQKRRRELNRVSLSSTNPLYRVVADDEAAMSFVTEENSYYND